MNKKTTWIIIGLLAVIIIVGVWYYNAKYKISSEKITNTETRDSLRQSEFFTGNEAYLLKGKLLDEKFRSDYDQLPDTLAVLEFGDKLYCTTCAYRNNGGEVAVAVNSTVTTSGPENKTYSLYDSREAGSIGSVDKTANQKWEKTYAFLKLAESGKAVFPAVKIKESGSSSTMLDYESFEDKYGNTFIDSYTRSIPTQIKDKILEFFASDEGKNYGFITTDQRVHSQLVRTGDFTGVNKGEIACVLGSKNDGAGSHIEKLMVFAINSQGEAYLLYSEDFRDKVLLETVYADPEERWDDKVYMDSDEKLKAPFEPIRIKIQNQPDIVLVYDEKFDKMNRYLQLPKSELERDSDTEE